MNDQEQIGALLDEAAARLELAAEMYLERGEDAAAEKILNMVLDLRPENSSAYNNLGILYRRRKRVSEALAAYEKALRAHPDDEHIYFNAARVFLDIENSIMAKKYLRRAIKLNPDFSEAIDLLRATEMGLKIEI